jgi:hypothetical protein
MSPRLPSAVATAVAALALLAGWGTPEAASGVTTTARGSVELLDCNRGKRAVDRDALFRGEMRQVAGGAAMRMRFDLQERFGRGDWTAVDAPGLELWRDAKPGIARFAYRQRIAALQRGTAYRVVVTFQWHDAGGALIAKHAARSPACRQPGRLPNLRVGRVDRLPGPTAGTARYVVSVLNRGKAAARKVRVSLLIDGAEVDSRGMGTIKAGARREIGFTAPVCASLITVEVDPLGSVREIDERDNARSFACPAAR